MKDKEEKKGKIQKVKTVDDKVKREKEIEIDWPRYNLVHGKYPNTKEITLLNILENILKKVIN
jgi:hypothetical protein